MSKYQPLQKYLAGCTDAEVSMQFSDIEHVIGDSLPPSAYRHRAWWSNNPTNSVITHAWLGAGYETAKVDMDEKRLIFRKAEVGSAPSGRPKGAEIMARIQASLGGTVRFSDDFDPTAPTGEVWNAQTQ